MWKPNKDRMKVDRYSDLVVDYNTILRFSRFVANDLHRSITIFGCQVFKDFPIVKPIKKACCNVVKANI